MILISKFHHKDIVTLETYKKTRTVNLAKQVLLKFLRVYNKRKRVVGGGAGILFQGQHQKIHQI